MIYLRKLALLLSTFSEKWLPSSFTIACLLTFLTFLLSVLVAHTSLPQSVTLWGDGFWELLTFSMQMCLVMFTGYIVAVSPPVSRFLNWLASLPKTPARTIFLMAFTSMILAWINWGLSIIGSAVLVRFIARNKRPVDYRLLVASAYLGLGCTWHAGLSASAPLLVATPGHFMEKEMGVIPLADTIFHPFNLLLTALVLLVISAVATFLHPQKEETVLPPAQILEEASDSGFGSQGGTPARSGGAVHPVEKGDSSLERQTPQARLNVLDRTAIVSIGIGAIGVLWILFFFTTKGIRELNINTVNFIFLILGVLLHKTPSSLLRASEEAGKLVHGVILQFPLYAGMYGIIKGSGLANIIGSWFVSIATRETFPAIVYWYSGIVNYFVPSGGSKWAIEAPYIVEAAKGLGVSLNKVTLSYAWGDMMTDVIQPFWAIPLLTVAKLDFKDIIGFAGAIFLVYFLLVSLAFLMFPF